MTNTLQKTDTPHGIKERVEAVKQAAHGDVSSSPVNLPSIPGQLTTVSYHPPADLKFDEWQAIGHTLFSIERAVQFWIGDWIRFGEKSYGEKYSQAIEETGLDYQTLANYAYVASKVEPSRRRENVSFSHHAEVAALAPEKQEAWLETAEAQNWTRSDLRKSLRETKELPPPTHYTMQVNFTVEAYKAARELEEHRNLTFDEAVCQAVVEANNWRKK
jgi:hypothetical protein